VAHVDADQRTKRSSREIRHAQDVNKKKELAQGTTAYFKVI
jgi:hypothetical protein